jgi:hypothetical protein
MYTYITERKARMRRDLRQPRYWREEAAAEAEEEDRGRR